MNSRRTPAFRAAFANLPDSARQQARDAYRLFLQNPNHPGLQFKPIGASIYSVRIGLHYRALGYLQGDTIAWIWIGTHAEYDSESQAVARLEKVSPDQADELHRLACLALPLNSSSGMYCMIYSP